MDDKDAQNTTPTETPGATMDIKPSANPMNNNATISPDANVSTQPPTASAEPIATPPTDTTPSPEAPEPSTTMPDGEANPQMPTPTKPKKGSKATKVILIIVIALVLAAAAAYLYLNKNKKSDSSTSTASNTSQSGSTTVTAKDVTSSIDEVDAVLTKADKVNDVASSDLSNSSLGL